jgi:hypothetical protein
MKNKRIITLSKNGSVSLEELGIDNTDLEIVYYNIFVDLDKTMVLTFFDKNKKRIKKLKLLENL